MWMWLLTMPGVATKRSPPALVAASYRARRSASGPTATISLPRTATAPRRTMSRRGFMVTT